MAEHGHETPLPGGIERAHSKENQAQAVMACLGLIYDSPTGMAGQEGRSMIDTRPYEAIRSRTREEVLTSCKTQSCSIAGDASASYCGVCPLGCLIIGMCTAESECKRVNTPQASLQKNDSATLQRQENARSDKQQVVTKTRAIQAVVYENANEDDNMPR